MINNKSYINGEWVSGLGKSFANINPSDTKDIISEYNECNFEQLGPHARTVFPTKAPGPGYRLHGSPVCFGPFSGP